MTRKTPLQFGLASLFALMGGVGLAIQIGRWSVWPSLDEVIWIAEGALAWVFLIAIAYAVPKWVICTFFNNPWDSD
jgi:hypothetical protein